MTEVIDLVPILKARGLIHSSSDEGAGLPGPDIKDWREYVSDTKSFLEGVEHVASGKSLMSPVAELSACVGSEALLSIEDFAVSRGLYSCAFLVDQAYLVYVSKYRFLFDMITSIAPESSMASPLLMMLCGRSAEEVCAHFSLE